MTNRRRGGLRTVSVQYRFFVVPTKECAEAESDLNRFLRSVRVLTIHREFVANGENSFWGMAVEYLSCQENAKEQAGKKGRVDYREVLSPEDFALFLKLREWRKDAANREAIPVYTIFTNEQLAEMAKTKPTSKGGLSQIDGVGDARIRKYGGAVLAILEQKGATSVWTDAPMEAE